MRVSINWIKEFVDLSGIEVGELVKRFNLATAEIEDVYYLGSNTKNVVLAKILEVKDHPQSKKLHILKVDDGLGEPTQVVCGAPNVRVGLVTAFARCGALVNGTPINKAKLAGVDSYGMCCGENELGIGSDESGIIELDELAPMGTDIKQVFPIDDVILEIDNKSLTNRPDLWGHYGLAREFAVIFNRKLKPLKVEDLNKYNSLEKLNIKVETKNCYRYSGITVGNVTKKVSPLNMKIKLNYCGMRDINLLADMTNYLMLEVGQPMHAFDNNIVKGITVTEPKHSVKMLTLEGEEHEVMAGSMLICDEGREPVAIAGIKGGKKSGISESTNSLLLESATFSPVSIRKSAKAVGLITDASLRYEKSLDPNLTVVAIARLLYILKNIDKGVKVTSALTDEYNFKYPIHTIECDYDFISRRAGIEIKKQKIDKILTDLGFELKSEGDKLSVVVPSWRGTKDVSIKEDLVEEVLRIYGYDNIMPKPLSFKLEPVSQDEVHMLEFEVKRLLAEKFGVSEVHTYLWNYEDFNNAHNIFEQSVVSLMDTSNSGQAGIRNKLAPSLIKVMYENRNNFGDIKICEIGRVASKLLNSKDLPNKNHLPAEVVEEQNHLCVVLASQTKTEEELYFELKRIMENLAGSLVRTKLNYRLEPKLVSDYLHPKNSCVVYAGECGIGEMGLINPKVGSTISPKHKIALLEIDFEKFGKATKVAAVRAQVSKFQSVSLDFNFLVPNNVAYSKIEEIISNFKCNFIMEHNLKDIYENSEVLGNNKSYTINFVITPTDKTLTTSDIETFSYRLIAEFKKNKIELRV